MLRLQAQLKVSSRGGRKLRAPSPPRLTFPGSGRQGTRPRPSPGPRAAAGRPCGRRGRGRRAPPPRAGGSASPPRPSGTPPPLPHRSTCTARLRKVPASAANFFTLKSIMFILGGSRAELPADLAGRRRRRGRAGASGGSGGGRRGRRRGAAPVPPPQLSFPSRGGEGGARGENERLPAGLGSGRPRPGRGACAFRSAAANAPVGPGGPAGNKRLGVRVVRSGSPAEEASDAAGRSLYGSYRGNSDP